MSALGNCLQPDTPLPVQMTAIMPCKDTARNGSTEGDPGFVSRQRARAVTPAPTLPGEPGAEQPHCKPPARCAGVRGGGLCLQGVELSLLC